jgi:hypothetical protein
MVSLDFGLQISDLGCEVRNTFNRIRLTDYRLPFDDFYDFCGFYDLPLYENK